LAGLERIQDGLGNDFRRPMFLELPEVRGLERTRIAEGHEAVHPAKRQNVEPIGSHLRYVFGIFCAPFWRWWVERHNQTLDETEQL
jgi:hypothetical protein